MRRSAGLFECGAACLVFEAPSFCGGGGSGLATYSRWDGSEFEKIDEALDGFAAIGGLGPVPLAGDLDLAAAAESAGETSGDLIALFGSQTSAVRDGETYHGAGVHLVDVLSSGPGASNVGDAEFV